MKDLSNKSAVDRLNSYNLGPLSLMSESQNFFALLDAMRAIILVLDRWGFVVHGNAQALNWRGRSNLVGKSVLEVTHNWENSVGCHQEVLQVVRTGQSIWQTIEHAISAGEESWFEVDKLPLKEESGKVSGVMLVIADITEHTLRQRALEESEARYRVFIANSADAIWRYDICPPIDTSLPVNQQVDQMIKRAVLVECNQKLARLFGADSVDEVIGMPIHRAGSMTARRDICNFIENDYKLEDQEFLRMTSVGERKVMQSSAIGIVENGYLTRAWGTSRDITDTKQYLDKLEYMATHDALTALPNRALLYRTIEQAFETLSGNNKMALLLIDLDRFKEINDTLGHLAGDKMLTQLGPRLENELSDTPGLVARLGGDEFAIFLPKIRNRQQAVVLAHRFLDSICQVFELEDLRTEISASIGVSLAPDQATDVSTLLRFADVAMYHAKSNLKGVSLYDTDIDLHSSKRLELMGALGRAIREDELFLAYQPKVCMQTNKIYGFEALIRWNHPELGCIPPSEFVPIAELSNVIYPMTFWVMEEAIRQCVIWNREGHDISIAMNLSARTLLDDRIFSDLQLLLDKYQLPSHRLEMEITESMIMSDPNRALLALERINSVGVKLSVDDFGTGYSSLAYLKKLPVKTLKIDASFVMSMLEDEQDEIIVNSTIQLAHNLGLEVVAEGVETLDVYNRLKVMGCDSAQGYYMARPMASSLAKSWLLESEWSKT